MAFRLKVSFRTLKQLLPFGAEWKDKTVSNLIESITETTQNKFFNGSKEMIRVAELRTLDGYTIDSSSIIGHVLRDNDSIEAVDYNEWKALCKTPVLDLHQLDFRNDNLYWARVGISQNNKLFLQLGYKTTSNMIWLALFDADALKHYAKDGKQLVVRRDGQSFLDDQDESDIEGKPALNPFFEIHFVITSEVVSEILVSVKTPTDQQPTITSIGVSIKNNKIILGEKKAIQTSVIESDVDYSLPSLVKEGKSFDDENVPQPSATSPPADVTPGEASVISMKQQDQVQPDQSRQATNSETGRGFKNIFYSNFHLVNKTEHDIVVSEVRSEYFDIRESPPAWKSSKTLIGTRNGFYNYSWNQRNTSFVLRANDVNNYVAVRTEVDLNDVPFFDQQRRAHHSLGNPVHIRVTLFDKDSKEITNCAVESKNEPLQLATISSVETKYENRKSDFFLSCDDLDAECRLYVAIFKGKHNDSERLEIYCQESNNSMWLYKSVLDKLAFEALQANNEEVSLEKPNFKGPSGQSVKAWALVDLKNRKVYAFKFELKTNTAKAIDYYKVPKLQ